MMPGFQHGAQSTIGSSALVKAVLEGLVLECMIAHLGAKIRKLRPQRDGQVLMTPLNL